MTSTMISCTSQLMVLTTAYREPGEPILVANTTRTKGSKLTGTTVVDLLSPVVTAPAAAAAAPPPPIVKKQEIK